MSATDVASPILENTAVDVDRFPGQQRNIFSLEVEAVPQGRGRELSSVSSEF